MYKLKQLQFNQFKQYDFDSSLDSNLTDGASDNFKGSTTMPNKNLQNESSKIIDIANYKTNSSHIMAVREKLKLKLKENASPPEAKSVESVNWASIYSKFVNNSLQKDQISKSQVEARINSVLNKYDDKKDRILKTEDNICTNNNLLFPNKYISGKDKGKFIQMLLGKYNRYDINHNNGKKRVNLSRNKGNLENIQKLFDVTVTTDYTKHSTNFDNKVQLQKGMGKRIGTRRNTRSECEAKKHFLSNKFKFANFSKQSSIRNSKDEKTLTQSQLVHKKLKSDLQNKKLETHTFKFEKFESIDTSERNRKVPSSKQDL